MTKRLAILAVILCAILVLLAGYILISNDFLNKVPETTPPAETEVVPNAEEQSRFFDTKSLLLCANKKHKLPNNYEPEDLCEPSVPFKTKPCTVREVMKKDLEALFEEAKNQSLDLYLLSGYRSDAQQEEVYEEITRTNGEEYAEKYSSRAGYSEHQTGLAVDIMNNGEALEAEFAASDEGKWLKDNAYRYGFILRYPEGCEEHTGFAYEPWHFRYIGREEAKKVYESGKCFEDYYGISGGDYE
ncbi:MAG: M15 family metallopeptidase [Solobacterium sp.]|nr:M15 family metallopeptidase [Solobacterium sp.]